MVSFDLVGGFSLTTQLLQEVWPVGILCGHHQPTRQANQTIITSTQNVRGMPNGHVSFILLTAELRFQFSKTRSCDYIRSFVRCLKSWKWKMSQSQNFHPFHYDLLLQLVPTARDGYCVYSVCWIFHSGRHSLIVHVTRGKRLWSNICKRDVRSHIILHLMAKWRAINSNQTSQDVSHSQSFGNEKYHSITSQVEIKIARRFFDA